MSFYDFISQCSNPEKLLEFGKWQAEQDKEVCSDGKPNYGAIGGVLTYLITPNSIGCVVKVQHGVTKEIFDLTDYDSW